MNLQYIFLILVITLTGCTRTLTVEEDSGQARKMEVKRDQVISEEIKVESTTEGQSYQTTRSCDHMGVCCKCGLTMHFEHECSCGVWCNCPGSQSVTKQPITKTFRNHYTLKVDNLTRVMKSPLYQQTSETVLAAGSCN